MQDIGRQSASSAPSDIQCSKIADYYHCRVSPLFFYACVIALKEIDKELASICTILLYIAPNNYFIPLIIHGFRLRHKLVLRQEI